MSEDVAELRRRLAEAEDTLRAIREGEVDAIVMRDAAEGDQVFPLGGAHDSYRAFMEAMDIGAAALDGERRLLYANGALATMLGRAPETLQRDGLLAAIGGGCAQAVERLIADADAHRQTIETALPCATGDRHVAITVAALPLGFGTGYALTFTDVTERIEAAAAEESERIGRAIMASASEAVVVCDGEGRITHANAAVRRLRDGGVVGLRFDEAFPLGFPIGSGVMHAEDLVAVALAGNTVRGVEAGMTDGADTRDLLVSASPLRTGGEMRGGCIVTLTDVTDRKDAEKRQRLMMAELAHRVKNTLTLVLSISSRTIAGARDLADFRVNFSRRIEALAATHNLLAEDAWTGLTLEDLINAELAPYVPLGTGRARLDLPRVRIATDTAIALGLIFHELVTNAVKYGALSNDTGGIAMTASVAADGLLTLEWRESGGPPVVPPQKTGFGQTVIARGLGRAEGAGTQVEFRPEGLVCRIAIPASSIA